MNDDDNQGVNVLRSPNRALFSFLNLTWHTSRPTQSLHFVSSQVFRRPLYFFFKWVQWSPKVLRPHNREVFVCVRMCLRFNVICVCVSSLQPRGVTLVQRLGAGPQVRPQHGTEIALCVLFFSLCVCVAEAPQLHPEPNSPFTHKPDSPS